jgi:hypothetical protein
MLSVAAIQGLKNASTDTSPFAGLDIQFASRLNPPQSIVNPVPAQEDIFLTMT